MSEENLIAAAITAKSILVVELISAGLGGRSPRGVNIQGDKVAVAWFTELPPDMSIQPHLKGAQPDVVLIITPDTERQEITTEVKHRNSSTIEPVNRELAQLIDKKKATQ